MNDRLEKQLYRSVRETCERYELLAAGDRIMVAMSGGKDSYALFHLLTKLVPRLPFKLELVAVHLDQVQPGYDGASLRAYLESTGWPFEILREDTYTVVTDRLDSAQTYCSLCSRLRRGILYTAAERLGCTKIALGHHRDDSLETFLLNLFYSGKLQAMPARYRTDDEADARQESRHAGYSLTLVMTRWSRGRPSASPRRPSRSRASPLAPCRSGR